MSAATMITCAANEILMGKHSFLGPIDPQLLVSTPLGMRSVPAQAVIDQFDRAQRECQDPAKLSAWLPMLGQYGPELLVRCGTALELSKELVSRWLDTYMFQGISDPDLRQQHAESVSHWLSDHKRFKSHSRHLSRDLLQSRGLAVTPLEDDELLQDLSLSVFHAVTHTFGPTPVTKIVENHNGRAFIKHFRVPQPPQAVQLDIAPIQPNQPGGMNPLLPLG